MHPPHAQAPRDASDQWLSDLADGRLEGEALGAACRRWDADEAARRTWHAYQLIGDVLRSDDLARAPAQDQAFLDALRERMAEEPVLLAPTPPQVAAARPRRQLWLLPVAAAAGFVAVTGVMVVLQQAAPGAAGFDAAQVAATPPAALTVAARAGVAAAGSAPGVPVPVSALAAPTEPTRMLREARVDEYLRAHRELLMGAPAALPGGAVRTVDFESAPQR